MSVWPGFSGCRYDGHTWRGGRPGARRMGREIVAVRWWAHWRRRCRHVWPSTVSGDVNDTPTTAAAAAEGAAQSAAAAAVAAPVATMGLTPIKLPYQSAKNRLFGVQPRMSSSFQQIPTFNVNDPYDSHRHQQNRRNSGRRNGLPINMLVSHQRRISNGKRGFVFSSSSNTQTARGYPSLAAFYVARTRVNFRGIFFSFKRPIPTSLTSLLSPSWAELNRIFIRRDHCFKKFKNFWFRLVVVQLNTF